jgi:ABC-type transport system substrate-binding protein
MATPALWSDDPTLEKAYRYDPQQAKQILEEAGWKVNPRTGVREKDGKPLKSVAPRRVPGRPPSTSPAAAPMSAPRSSPGFDTRSCPD